METLLHKGTICLVSGRSRARSNALGETRDRAATILTSKRHFAPGRIGVVAGLVVTIAMAGQFAVAQDVKRGEDLLVRNCASYHAVGRSGDSPRNAPPFRSLGQRYPIESLEEA